MRGYKVAASAFIRPLPLVPLTATGVTGLEVIYNVGQSLSEGNVWFANVMEFKEKMRLKTPIPSLPIQLRICTMRDGRQ